MNDHEKWLAAATGLEQDIHYLQAASQTASADAAQSLRKSIEHLYLAVAVYKENASAGMPWPSPDDLFCINVLPSAQISTGMRRDFKFAN